MGMRRQRAVDYSGNGPFVDFDKKNDRGDFAVMKTLLSLFEDSAALVENPLGAADVDWRALGVGHKYIIFLTSRCGST